MANATKKPCYSAINRYNKKVYSSICVRLPKEKVAEFKEKCQRDGIPQAQIFLQAIDEFLAK
mgnify:CR=1 FL=1